MRGDGVISLRDIAFRCADSENAVLGPVVAFRPAPHCMAPWAAFCGFLAATVAILAAAVVRLEDFQKSALALCPILYRLFHTFCHTRAQKRLKRSTSYNCQNGGPRMKWLLAWIILNALVFVWRVLVVWPQLKAKDQSVSVRSANVDRARAPASPIQAAARAVGHGAV